MLQAVPSTPGSLSSGSVQPPGPAMDPLRGWVSDDFSTFSRACVIYCTTEVTPGFFLVTGEQDGDDDREVESCAGHRILPSILSLPNSAKVLSAPPPQAASVEARVLTCAMGATPAGLGCQSDLGV